MHYALSTVDKDIGMLVQDTSASYSDANLSYKALPGITSDYPPTSTIITPITRFTRDIGRSNYSCVLIGLSDIDICFALHSVDTYFSNVITVVARSCPSSTNVCDLEVYYAFTLFSISHPSSIRSY